MFQSDLNVGKKIPRDRAAERELRSLHFLYVKAQENHRTPHEVPARHNGILSNAEHLLHCGRPHTKRGQECDANEEDSHHAGECCSHRNLAHFTAFHPFSKLPNPSPSPSPSP